MNEEDFFIGGDFNWPLNPGLDKIGGVMIPRRDAISSIDHLQNKLDQVVIWIIKNPVGRSYTWSQQSPKILSFLDYWLICNNL